VLLAVLLCATAAVAPLRDDVAQALSRLSSPDSEVRRLAEGWLSAHLALTDYPAVAEAAAAGDTEVRARIVRALASDDRHLGLCALLCTERSEDLAALGERAATELFTGWLDSPELEAVPRDASSIQKALQIGFENPERMTLGGASLEAMLDRISRLADPRRTDDRDAGSTAIVLDPSWTGSGSRSSQPVELAPGERGLGALVLAAASSAGAQIDLYSWSGKRPWILVGAPRTASPYTAAECVAKWLRESVLETAKPRGVASARALASLGWPAPVDWMARRWTADPRDGAALAGLTLAAARGRVAPVLATRESVRRLLELADGLRARTDEASRFRGDETVRALLAIGGVGGAGEDLSAVAAEGWSAAQAAGRANRRAIFAGLGRAPDAVRADLRAQLAAPGDPRERLAALRMLAATSSTSEPATVVLGPGDLLRTAAALGQVGELLDACWRLQIAVSPQWLGDGSSRATELALLAHWLERDSTAEGKQAAAQLVRKWLREPDSELVLGAVLRRAASLGARGAIEALLDGVPADAALAADRVALLAGVLPSAGLERIAAALALSSAWSIADWIVAGARLVHPDAPEVEPFQLDSSSDPFQRAFAQRVRAVIQRIEAAGPDPGMAPAELAGLGAGWVRGLERAVVDLRARDEDVIAAQLCLWLRSALLHCPHDLKLALRDGRWPARPDRDLALFEPWLGD
jgi:hypothetical protein